MPTHQIAFGPFALDPARGSLLRDGKATLKSLAPSVTVASIRAGQPGKDPTRLAAILEGFADPLAKGVPFGSRSPCKRGPYSTRINSLGTHLV